MFGPWLSPEQEIMREGGAIFEKATGATFEYGGSDSFEQQVMIDLKAGSDADLVVFPQPGLAANAAAMGGLVPLGDDIKQMVLDNYAAGQSWVDLSTYADENGNDQFNAIFFRTNVKSLVWYSPDNFEDNGYEVPGTMEELIALTRQMASDGNTPWCIGLGSGAATGWPATDWMEDIMLRTHTPDVYDMWVSNEMPFNDPRVIEAMNFFGTFALNDKFVNGGSKACLLYTSPSPRDE